MFRCGLQPWWWYFCYLHHREMKSLSLSYCWVTLLSLSLSFSLSSQSLSNVSRDEAGVKLVHEYYNQLQLVSKRFIHSSMKHGLAFIWYVDTLSVTSFPISIPRTAIRVHLLFLKAYESHEHVLSQGLEWEWDLGMRSLLSGSCMALAVTVLGLLFVVTCMYTVFICPISPREARTLILHSISMAHLGCLASMSWEFGCITNTRVHK